MSEKTVKKERKAKLYGADGKEIETRMIPVVKFKDFTFAIQPLQKEEIALPKDGGYRPGDLVKEYRARCRELEDRLQILTAIVCTMVKDGNDAGKEFLDGIGARVADVNDKVLYEPNQG